MKTFIVNLYHLTINNYQQQSLQNSWTLTKKNCKINLTSELKSKIKDSNFQKKLLNIVNFEKLHQYSTRDDIV